MVGLHWTTSECVYYDSLEPVVLAHREDYYWLTLAHPLQFSQLNMQFSKLNKYKLLFDWG